MIFQEPMTLAEPVLHGRVPDRPRRCGCTRACSARGARARVRWSCWSRSASPTPEARLGAYPHQLSGGMSQRVMIAMAIACNPKLLIADEPTTALDVTIQAQILDLLLDLQRERGMALVLITHDMGVVAETVERVVVHVCRPAGRGAGRARACSPTPHHPYTRGAARARCPSAALGRARLPTIPGVVPGRRSTGRGLPVQAALRVRHRPLPRDRSRRSAGEPARPGALPLPADPSGVPTTAIPARRGGRMSATRRSRHGICSAATTSSAAAVQEARPRSRRCAACRFTLDARPHAGGGRRIGLRQDRTLARLVTLIEPPTAGALLIDGSRRRAADAASARPAAAARCRSCSRTPTARSTRARRSAPSWRSRWSINTDVGTARARRGGARHDAPRSACGPSTAQRYPHMFSGGQRQRIAIARALMLQPKIVVARRAGLGARRLDPGAGAEPAGRAAGGVPARLPVHLPRPLGRAPLRRRRAGHVSRPGRGAGAERGNLRAPRHPYTRILLAATPTVDVTHHVQAETIRGELPSPLKPPVGCAFASRCPSSDGRRCVAERPELRPLEGHLVACHYAEAVGVGGREPMPLPG